MDAPTDDDTYVHHHADGDGPCLLATHGYGASSAMFADLPAALQHSWKVIRWDLRGHGASDAPDAPDAYTPARTLADMAALLDVASASSSVLVGHSVGGYLSLLFALAHPERVEGLVLIATGPGFRSLAARNRWNAMTAGYATALEQFGLDGLPDSPERRSAGHRSVRGLVHAAQNLLPQHDSSVIDGLGSITAPTLVVVGADDALLLDGSRYLAEKIPRAELVVVPDAGHAPNLDQPEQFATVLRRFLDGLAPR